jgi:hypothetical protein
MKKIISSAGYYELSIPETWTYEQHDNLLSIFPEKDGAGALEISSFAVSETYAMDLRQELAEYIAEKLSRRIEDVEKDIITEGALAFIRVVQPDAYWEYRMMFEKQVLLLITYNCSFEDAAAEEPQLGMIMRSISIAGKKGS